MSIITKQEVHETTQVAAIAAALRHVLRIRIMRALADAEGAEEGVSRRSPSELAELLGEPLGNVSYHVRQLAGAKMVKLVKKTPRRGAIEHYYELTVAGRDALRLLDHI